MSQRDDTGFKSFEADEAIELYSRVTVSNNGKIVKAGLTDRAIGTLQTMAATAQGDVVPVKLRTASGTHKVRMSEACDAGAVLYTESDGELQDTAQATSFLEATALEESGAEDDVIEVCFVAGSGAAN